MIIAVVAAIAAVAAVMIRDTPSVTSTTLPTQRETTSPEVGMLTLAAGSLLSIVTPEFTAEFDDSGVGRIVRLDATRTPPEPLPSEKISLDRHTLAKLLGELGRLKVAWSARKVGEAALSPDLRDLPQEEILDESNPILIIEEKRSDGTSRPILLLTAESPEYKTLWDALTPLRLR